jgi:predicted metal-binding membrane protein
VSAPQHAVTAPTAHDRVFFSLLGALVLLAWLALAIWSTSPYARYLSHDWTQLGLAASLCAALPAGELLLPAALFVGGWVLMTAAMMLPTTLPFVAAFRRLTARHDDRGALLGALIGGYVLAWLAFGVGAHLVGLGLAEGVRRSDWLTFNGWAIAVVVLLAAGLFQFSSLKYRCLEECRSPLGFIAARWSGRRPWRESVRLGWAHGLFCVGCCWALMALMFVVGAGSIFWMLALGAVMALEKNRPWGRRMAAPLGLGLVAAAGVVAAGGLAG